MRYCLIFSLLCQLIVFPSTKTFSQDSLAIKTDPIIADSVCQEKDLPQLIRQWIGKPPVTQVKLGSLIIVPSIGSNPAMGFMYGVGGQYAFRFPDPISLYSVINASALYTTKNQLLIQMKNNIYTKDNKFFLSGDWRFLKFSQSTYGLGTNAPEGGLLKFQYNLYGIETTDDSLVQPMKFNHVRVYQTASMKIKESVYVGLGYHLDYHYDIIDEKLDTSKFLSSHYLYSKAYGFNPDNYLTSGIIFSLIADTRDNMINAYKGFFANVDYRVFPTFMGSEKNGQALNIEWRSFHSLSKRNPRHSIALWLYGSFTSFGQLPYLDLPALGYDQRGRGGRGYTQGRYRGPNLVYGETEYRFPISRCGGVLGGVIFANATTADKTDNTVKLFDYIIPGYGLGLRLMVDKHSRTNLGADFGFGQNSGGFYLNAGETF